MNNRYTTKDLGEAAVLLTKGFILIDTEWMETSKGSVAYFNFDNYEEAKRICYQYNFGGVQVSAKDFYANMITIKRKILSRYNPKKFRKDVRTYAVQS